MARMADHWQDQQEQQQGDEMSLMIYEAMALLQPHLTPETYAQVERELGFDPVPLAPTINHDITDTAF